MMIEAFALWWGVCFPLLDVWAWYASRAPVGSKLAKMAEILDTYNDDVLL